MPKSIAQERIKLVALTTKPVNVLAPTAVELNAGVDLSLKVLFSDFKLGPKDSETVNEPALGEGGNSPAIGKANFEGSVTVFRFLDATTGLPVALEDTAWAAMKTRGTELHLYKRVGPKFSATFAAAQELEYYHVITDHPQDPSDMGGYIKKTIPLLVQGDSAPTGVVAA